MQDNVPILTPHHFSLWSVNQFLTIRITELRAENVSNKSFSLWVSPREERDFVIKPLKELRRELCALDLCIEAESPLAELEALVENYTGKGGETSELF